MPDCSLGPLLRSLRRTAGLTQSETAFRAAISARHLSFLETGRARPSRGAIDRLAQALRLTTAQADAARLAAGFAPEGDPAARPDMAADLFTLAIQLEAECDLAAMIGRARPVLSALGIRQYFFGRIRRSAGGRRAMSWYNPATFPAGWLERYSANGYAATDPLLAMAERSDRSFLWIEAGDASTWGEKARCMFDAAATGGITNGAVVPLHRADGAADFVSFMGEFGDSDPRLVRVGLQTIGLQLLGRVREPLDRIGTGSPYLPGN